MVDEIKKEEVKQPSMIESATEAANRLKEENARMESNIKRLEELKAFEALGGKTEGAPQVQPKAEVDPRDYAKMVLQGKILPKQ